MGTTEAATGTLVLFGSGSEWFWAMAQAIGVSATLLLILRQITLQGQATALSALGGVNQQWTSPAVSAARATISSAALAGTALRGSAPVTVATFFEELGLHLRKRVVDIEDVWERYSVPAEIYWNIMSPGIVELRESGDSSWYSNFEYLVVRLRRYDMNRRKRGLTALLSKIKRKPQNDPQLSNELTAENLRFCELECEICKPLPPDTDGEHGRTSNPGQVH